MYLPVNFSSTQISALLDTGSTINLMSHELFDRLPVNNKAHVDYCHESNRKAMNRNWSNQKANPALKTKAGDK